MSNTSSTSENEHYIRPYTDLDGETIETIWLPSTRREAKARGESLYWTGKACLRGHIAPRYASNGACVRCQRERIRSPEVREYHRQWREENREKVREYHRQWIEENPDRFAALIGKADAEKRAPGCTPDDFDIEPTTELYAKARHLSREAGTQYHVDHAVPLSLGGRHEASNLRVVTAGENVAKGRIERRLVEAINSDAPLDNYHAVYADVKGDLAELCGAVLCNKIYIAGLRLANEAEARLSDKEAA